MKPIVNDKKCGASQNSCKAIKACPSGAMSYIEVAEALLDREVMCIKGSCDCESEGKNDCGGSPYGRIIIDYDKCTLCGICAVECCGDAIDMV